MSLLRSTRWLPTLGGAALMVAAGCRPQSGGGGAQGGEATTTGHGAGGAQGGAGVGGQDVNFCQAGQTSCEGGCVDTSIDLGHCGACGNACGAGAWCEAAQCISCPGAASIPCHEGCTCSATTLVTLGDLGGMAVIGDQVYWSEKAWWQCVIGQVPSAGGEPTCLVDNQDVVSTPGARSIAADDVNVYWTTDASASQGRGAVMKVPRSGGAPVALASEQPFPHALTVDAAHVYWLNQGDPSVMSVPIGGGTPIALAVGQGQIGTLAVDGVNVYWSDNDVSDVHAGALMKTPVGGGASVKLADARTTSIAVKGGTVFWTNEADGTIMSVPISGGAPTTIASNQEDLWAIAADDTHVYWATLAPSLNRAPRNGGPVELLETGLVLSFVAVDIGSVYWGGAFPLEHIECPGGEPCDPVVTFAIAKRPK